MNIFFFDIDGTLLPEEYEIPSKKTIYALKELINKGNIVFIATGKSLKEAQEIGKKTGITNFITTNGQVIYINNELVYNNAFSNDEIKQWYELTKKHNCLLGLQGNYETYVLPSDKYNIICDYFDLVKLPHPKIKSKIDESFSVQQMLIVGETKNIKYDVNKYKIVKWVSHGADILPKNASKGEAILNIKNRYDKSAIFYAFGDGHNDIEMLKEANYGLAMGNAHQDVKNFADEIIKPAIEDGVYDYLVKNNFIGEYNE